MKLQKSISYYMRALHRDIGFFVIGLTVIFCISGVILIYRETGLLKQERSIEKHLSPYIDVNNLGRMLHLRDFKVFRTDGDIVYFQNGTYNKKTGIVKYSAQTLPAILERFNKLHIASNNNFVHWFSLLYCVALFFLAISSLWMYKPGVKMFRRGVYITIAGIFAAVILLFI